MLVWACLRALGPALACLLAGVSQAHARVTDSTFTRIELGGATDITNELYYEDTYSDTLFLGRRIASTPEVRTGAVLSIEHQRALTEAPWWLRAHLDAQLGDKVQRVDAMAQFRSADTRAWRGMLEPSFQLRADRSFGESRRDWRARLGARATHRSLDEVDTFEWASAGEVVRADAQSNAYVLDRDALEASASWGHSPTLAPWNSRLSYHVIARAFPDSGDRDHVEHRLEWSVEGAGAGAVVFATAGAELRSPRVRTTSTRDDFWSTQADLAAQWRPWSRAGLDLRLVTEGFRYRAPDSVAYFDYQLFRAHSSLRVDLPGEQAVAMGPAMEWLRSPLAPGERYQEWGVQVDWEHSSRALWYSLGTRAGVRRYADGGSSQDFSVHSDYRFVEFQALVDQPLPLRCRLRVMGTVRLEAHDDPSQDARSLYFSVDLRRLL